MVPTAVLFLILAVAYRLCRPLGDPPEARVIEHALRTLDEKGLGDREIISAVVWMDYAKGHTLSPRRPNVRQRLAEAEIGTLFAWERQFAASQDHGLPGREFASSPSWRPVLASLEARRGTGPYLIIYEKTGPWSGKP